MKTRDYLILCLGLTLFTGVVPKTCGGSEKTYSVRLEFAAAPASMALEITLPTGWSYSGGTNEPAIKPQAGHRGQIAWVWTEALSSPVEFGFAATHPDDGQALPELTGRVFYLRDDRQLEVTVKTEGNLIRVSLPTRRLQLTVTAGVGIIATGLTPEWLFDGDQATIKAEPWRWHRFVRWDNGSTEAQRTITVGARNAYSAAFEPTQPLEAVTNKSMVRLGPVGMPQVMVDGDLAITTPPPGQAFQAVVRGDQAEISLATSLAGGLLFYTTDGSAPNFDSTAYTAPFTVTKTTSIRAIAYSVDFSQTLEEDPVPVRIVPTYTITTQVTGPGSVFLEPTAARYLEGANVTVRTVPASGWQLSYWKGAVTGTNAEISITMDRAKTVEAVFGTAVNTTVAGPGRVELVPAAGPYPYGSVVLIVGLPDAGNYMARWGNAGSGSFNPLAFVVTNANPVVSALFSTIPAGKVALHVDVVGSGSVLANPARNYFDPGQTVSLTAIPGPGVYFLGWTGTVASAMNPLTLTMTNQQLVAANFGEIQAPHIVEQPMGRVVSAGENVTLFVGATGGGLAYQWYHNGSPEAGGLNSAFNLSPVTLTDFGNYYCVVSNVSGVVTSTVARLTASQTIAFGSLGNKVYGDAAFTLSASASSSLPVTFSLVSGPATLAGNTLTLTGAGQVTIEAAQTGNGIYQAAAPVSQSFTVFERPQITRHPVGGIARLGESVSMNAEAQGSPPLIFHWLFNGAPITGATNRSHQVNPFGEASAGAYALWVTNSYGVAISSNAVFSLVPVVAWGDNTHGQIQVPLDLKNLVALAAGRAHNLVLRRDGTLAVWGDNDSGQTNVPPGLSNVLAIAAGGVQSLALKADGSVVGWGDDWAGQATVPSGLSNAVAIASGRAFNLALQADGTLVGWGNNDLVQTNIPADLRGVIAIAAGAEHALALKADGTVAAWGLDDNNQTQVPPGLSNVVAIAAGSEHSLALTADGIVIGWGNDSQGQTLEALHLTNVVAIAAGRYHSLALKRDGTLAAAGFNDYGQTHIPAGLTNVVAIAAGETHSLALLGPLAPWLLTPVPDRLVNPGDALSLQARVNGSLPLSYQWYQDGVALVESGRIRGATDCGLRIADCGLADAGNYRVVVTNSYGSVTSRVAAVRVAVPPGILQQPLDRTAKEGTNVVLAVTAVGATPIYYQWYKGANNLILSATNSAFSLQPLALGHAGDYFCVVSNAFGGVTSRVSRVTVISIGLPEILINGQLLATNMVSITNAVELTLRTDYPGGIIYYSLDGSDPLGAGVRYEGPFTLTHSVILWVKALNSTQTAWQEVSGIAVEIIPHYTLLVLPGFGGQVSGGGGSYLRDTEVTVTAVSSNGWVFVGWSGDATGTNNPLRMVMTREKSVQARFGTAMTTTPLGGGTVTRSPDLAIYPYGSTVRLTALPNSGNYFKWWGGAAAGQSNSPLVFTITSTTPNVSALFASLDANYFSLNVLVQGQGEVLASPARSFYSNNTPVTVTATPAADWTFTGWSGVSNSLQNPLLVLMNSSKILTAVFRTNTANDLPPSVALVAPTNNARFYLPADIALEAAAADSDGQVVTVGFYVLAAGATSGPVQLGVVSESPYRLTWTNVSLGNYLLTAIATDDLGVSSTSAPVSLTVSERGLTAAVFSLSSASYSVAENAGYAMVTVCKNPFSFAASVNYGTAGGTARATTFNQPGDFAAVSGVLNFGTNETTRTLQIPIEDDAFYEGNQSFTFNLVGVSDGAAFTQPSQATVTIIDDDPPASTNSLTSYAAPASVPAGSGSLRIYLEPANAGGQWRFLWETAWRNSSAIASELVPGNYPVEFKPVSGFLQPPVTTNIVTAGTLTVETNAYFVDAAPQFGALSVVVQPSSVANAMDVAQRGQWRLQGATHWLDSGVALSNLVAGDHIVEFKTVPGFSTPPGRIAVVAPGQENGVAATYLLSASAPGSGPSEIASFDEIRDSLVNGFPFCFAGQLLTDAGYGSGVVVKRRVVLTAAHVVFNEASLSFVDTVWWFFQRHRGEYEPIPQPPRGWYVYSGYAAQRTNDNSPGVSSPASQNLDLAALYFTADAGRGGYGGYLTSDAADHEWLMSSTLKILVGYPVETVLEEDRGRMHWVAPGNYGFGHVPGANQVYSTIGMKSYPGNSGGPLCVLYNGKYYPAGVYLGGSGQSVVRAIDGGVVDLINRAEVTANTGDNNTGGGVITVVAGKAGTGTRAYVKVRLGPAGAVAAGAAWRLQGETNWLTATNMVRSVAQGGSVALEFREMAGWGRPTNRSVTLVLGQTAVIDGNYVRLGPGLSAPTRISNGVFAFGLSGQAGMVYVLEASTNLAQTHWLILATNRLGDNGVWQFTDPAATHLPARFYRARE